MPLAENHNSNNDGAGKKDTKMNDPNCVKIQPIESEISIKKKKYSR